MQQAGGGGGENSQLGVNKSNPSGGDNKKQKKSPSNFFKYNHTPQGVK
jgi:hypothetical protein